MIGIYKITSPTNRIYIGQGVDIMRRFRFYKQLNCKRQPILYRSFLKYGVEKHTFEIIEECLFEQLNIRERYWQDFYNVLKGGLNCYLTETNELPRVHSQETIDKISKSNTGKIFSESTIRKMSDAKKTASFGKDNNFYGKHHTAIFKQKLSIIRSGKNNSKAKLVLNLETGIYYDTAIEVANMLSINKRTLTGWLAGKYNNKTSFRYV